MSKISAMPIASALDGHELFPAVQNGSNVRISAAQITSFVGRSLENITALRASKTLKSAVYLLGYATPADGGGGMFIPHPTDASSPDNGGTIIVDAAGRRWYREMSNGPVSATWFGARGDGSDDTIAIQSALNAHQAVRLPGRYGNVVNYITSRPLRLRAGQHLIGDGAGASRIVSTVENGNAVQCTAASLSLGYLAIRDLSIACINPDCVGIATVLVSDVTIENIEFLGCEAAAISADRGHWHQSINCVSRPTATRKAGQFRYYSSSDTDYCFYPVIRNCKVHALDEMGLTTGVKDRCMLLRRCIGAHVYDFIAKGLDGADGILLENDCQGVKVIGGMTQGAGTGLRLQAGTGVAAAPGYIDILSHDVDGFSTAGIAISGTGAAPCADVLIQGGKLTAPRGKIPMISIAQTLKAIVSGVTIDDYTAKRNGVGIELLPRVTVSLIGNRIDHMDTGINVTASVGQVTITDNTVTNCHIPAAGFSHLAGNGSRVGGNLGIPALPVSTPRLPASGSIVVNNTGCDVVIYLNGGQSVVCTVNGSRLEPAPSVLFLAANATMSLSYGVAPSWTWVAK